jgi:hypothetical protein
MSPSLGGLFVDWLPKNLGEKRFLKQAAILQEYVKIGIPVVLFDRHTSIDQKQYRWLSKFNVTFFEPRINFRTGFEWCPQWTTPLPDKWWTGQKDTREIGLAYEGPLSTQIKSFEKYYQTYAQMFPGVTTAFTCTDLKDWKGHSQIIKLNEFKEHNLDQSDKIDFNQVDIIILIGSIKDYASGCLPDNLFSMMKMGVIPLLPIEHRFFGTMFDNLIIRDERDLDYAIKTFPRIREVIIEEIFENIFDRFPEFKIEYMVERLKQCLMI